MVAVGAQDATSSTSGCQYHVFLSFRGQDTGKTFSDHLFSALMRAGFHTFRDDDGISEREDFKLELQKATVQSKISIVVFSKDYASSEWCLDELVLILERMKTSKHAVLPVFYHVDPSEVRKQTGVFAEAFSRHEEQFSQEKDGGEKVLMDKVKRWREALKEVADLAGMVLQNEADGHESKFIQKIVQVIVIKLSRTALNIPPNPIGIYSRALEINLWIQGQPNNVGIIVICGIGGIGKTTIAKFVYNVNYESFAGSSFLANIKEISKQPYGLVRLQKQLISDILKQKKERIWNVDEGIIKIKEALCSRKILLVLDDVADVDQLDAILGMRNWFYPGSKIIITTRHELLLKPHEFHKDYKIEKLDDDESLELFSWHTFGQDQPLEGYMEHSRRVVQQCGGLPLALQVLGSSLSGKHLDVWESALRKLEVIPHNQVVEKLKLSYESLPDDHDKQLFLHIACFFVGKDRDYVVRILDGCDFYTIVGIQNLIDASLMTFDRYNKLLMHQLIQDMGRDIVRQESPRDLGKRSRLWHHRESVKVLKERTGTGTIEGIILDMSSSKESDSTRSLVIDTRKRPFQRFLANPSDDSSPLKRRRFNIFSWASVDNMRHSKEIILETRAFSEMNKLRLLKLNYVRLTGPYKEFPQRLRWLCWHNFPLESIPIDFPLESLVAIDMRHSSLKRVWEGTKFLGVLKLLNLSHSHALTKTPDFLGLPNLEKLILKYCRSLVDVHESIGCLKRLVVLNLKDCKSLSKLPRNISMLKSLEVLDISGCSSLQGLPRELNTIDSLKVVHADRIDMNQAFSITEEIQPWQAFISSWLSKPRKSPEISWATLPHALLRLSLVGCNLYDDAFSLDFSRLSLLQELNLSRNPIHSLPESIRGLTSLHTLDLQGCTALKSLTGLPTMKELYVDHCCSLEKISYQSPSCRLQDFGYGDCDNLMEIRGQFKLKPLKIADVEMLVELGLLNLGSVENIKVNYHNRYSSMKPRKLPLQRLYEDGVFSYFLPGSKIPDQFSCASQGPPICYVMPSFAPLRIQGLLVCSMYARSSNQIPPAPFDIFEALECVIENRIKKIKWTYRPFFLGVPEADEDMIWLSHWNFGDMFEGGDEVMITVHAGDYFEVKKVAIQVWYNVQGDKNDVSKYVVPKYEKFPFKDTVPRDLSVHNRVYFDYL